MKLKKGDFERFALEELSRMEYNSINGFEQASYSIKRFLSIDYCLYNLWVKDVTAAKRMSKKEKLV